MSYKIGIIGTGYVGLVTGTCFAETGNNVWCVDIDKEKIAILKKGKPTIFEPGLERLLKTNIEEGRLFFTTSLEEVVLNCTLFFLCLPTPPNEDGSADLKQVIKVTEDIANLLKKNEIFEKRIVVNKSTVPVGTTNKLRNIFREIVPQAEVEVASNPEFLREGFAVEDAMKPERVVIGTSSDYVELILRDLYQPFVRSGNPIICMDEKSAEVTKYAANSFLATKISFMNDLSRYCEIIGADIDKVRIGIGSDSRIGKRFLFAGIGYGGSCFPKDVKALIHSAEQVGVALSIVKAAQHVNEYQIKRFIKLIKKRFDYKISNKKFALWGLAFKPNTDDVREAPSFRIIDSLLEDDAIISCYDQEAMENTRKHYGDKLHYAKNPYECLENADALIIATEWNVFRNPDFQKIKSLMKTKLIFDGRNVYNISEIKNWGFEYYCVGRPAVIPTE